MDENERDSRAVRRALSSPVSQEEADLARAIEGEGFSAGKPKRRQICVAFESRFSDLSSKIVLVTGPLRVEHVSHAHVDSVWTSVIVVLTGPEDVVRSHEEKLDEMISRWVTR